MNTYVYRDARPYALAVFVTQGLYFASVVVNLAFVFAILGGAVSLAPLGVPADLLVLGSFVLAAFTFAVWTWRVVANARTFKPNINASPGWAIGWYFVPVAWLWKPYGYLQETWDASTPTISRHSSLLLRWWWGLWLGTGIVSSIGTRLAAAEGGGLNLGMVMVIVALFGRLVLSALVIRLALTLAALQKAKREGGGAAEVFA